MVIYDCSTNNALEEKECTDSLYVDPEPFHSMLSFLLLKSSTSQNAEQKMQAIKGALVNLTLSELFRKLIFHYSNGASVNKAGFKLYFSK